MFRYKTIDLEHEKHLFYHSVLSFQCPLVILNRVSYEVGETIFEGELGI